MRYTIKTISELIGIAPQTIRYYEDKGMLAPQKDARNGYRYYTVWDYAVLLMARRYLRYGCSVDSSSELLNPSPLENTLEMTRTQEKRIEKEIAEKVRVLENLRRWRSRLEQIQKDEPICHIGMRPGIFRLENMEDVSFMNQQEIFQRTQQWLGMSPFVFNTMRYPLQDVLKDTGHRFSALGILEEDAHIWNITQDQYVKYHRPCLCVIQTIGGECFDTMLPLSRRIGGALDFMQKNGLKLAGDVMTRMDFVQRGKEGYLSYQTAWLPIEEENLTTMEKF